MSDSSPKSPSYPAPQSVSDDHVRAARIVESLFRVTPATCWDLLLDLRQALVEGWDAARTLPIFQNCRRALELDHYLLFYRLRRLLEPVLASSLAAAESGGRGGIRTRGEFYPTFDFESSALNRAQPPFHDSLLRRPAP